MALFPYDVEARDEYDFAICLPRPRRSGAPTLVPNRAFAIRAVDSIAEWTQDEASPRCFVTAVHAANRGAGFVDEMGAANVHVKRALHEQLSRGYGGSCGLSDHADELAFTPGWRAARSAP